MKRIIFASVVLSLFSGITVTAQNNSYQDDVYYNGSQAEKDAKAEAKRQKKQQNNNSGTENYNSSDANYDNNGNGQVYNNSYSNQDDAYVDYDDDDSYTSRIRRFYYPMSSVGYWGSVYSPFYYDPFYSNPYYGWGNWYSPGISIGIGFGGPYWSNCWGMSTWFGYGGFGSWYNPYGGYGYGGYGGYAYGAGYWNGYYSGMNDAGRYGYGRTIVNNGPRGSGRGARDYNVGAYGSNAGLRASNVRGGNSTFEPQNGRRQMTGTNVNANSTNRVTLNNGNFQQVESGRSTNISNRNINLNQGDVREFNGNSTGRQEVQQTSRRGFFNSNNNNSGNSGNNVRQERISNQRVEQNNNYSPAPQQQQRTLTPAPQQQQRSNFSPAPSRSFSPAPSRSSGSFGGGSRSMGGGRR